MQNGSGKAHMQRRINNFQEFISSLNPFSPLSARSCGSCVSMVYLRMYQFSKESTNPIANNYTIWKNHNEYEHMTLVHLIHLELLHLLSHMVVSLPCSLGYWVVLWASLSIHSGPRTRRGEWASTQTPSFQDTPGWTLQTTMEFRMPWDISQKDEGGGDLHPKNQSSKGSKKTTKSRKQRK